MREIQVYRLVNNAILPKRNLTTDAGMDLFALEDTYVSKNSSCLVKTGVAINIPEGYVGKLEDRSSMGLKGFKVCGGVIDAGYSGEVGVVLRNFDAENDPLPPHGYKIKRGDKIAQLLLYKVETPAIVEVNEIWNSERGSNGFGSSGL